MTNKQASGIGHTLSASACFRIQAHQNMQSLLGFDSRINKHPRLGTPQVHPPVSPLQVHQICARCRCMYCCDCEGGVRLLFHGNLGSLANNRNAFHFLRDCMAMFKAPRKLLLCSQTCPVRPSGHAYGADRLLH
jgi:hypothetical protein